MDKLITDKLSIQLDQHLRNDLIDNFKKIENNEVNINNKDSAVVDIANKANDLSNDTKQRLDNFVANNEQPSEVVDSRHSSTTGKNFSLLSDRLNEIEEYQRLGIVNFTFDDSYRENRLTKQIFDEYGLICDFAIITDKVNSQYNDYQGIDWYLDAQNAGYGIQSHTRNHTDLRVLDNTAIAYREIVTSKEILNELGLQTSGLVAPLSVFNYKYEPLIKQNYDYAVNHSAVNSINAPMDKSVDRYHLQRMSLASTDINVIKQAIDKTIDEKLLLMFYDHRTGYEGSATEEKLREVLDYVKEKVTEQRLEVLKSVDAIAEYFKVTQVLPRPTQARAKELALPIGRYLVNREKDNTVWNITAKGNPKFHYTPEYNYNILSFDKNAKIDGAEMYQVIDVTKPTKETRPHFLSISAPMNAAGGVFNDLEVKAFARCYDANGNQLGNIEEKPFYIEYMRKIYNKIFSYPDNAATVEIGFIFESDVPLSGNLNVFQPSILEDQIGYTGGFSDVETPMQFGLTPTVGTPRSWSFASLPSFTLGLARRYFTYDQTKNYITCIIPGTYEFRIVAGYNVSGVKDWVNPRVLIELRVNDDDPNNTNAIYRAQSTYSVGNVFNIDSNMKITLKTGDVIRFATDFDMLDTPKLDNIANSFVIVRREI